MVVKLQYHTVITNQNILLLCCYITVTDYPLKSLWFVIDSDSHCFDNGYIINWILNQIFMFCSKLKLPVG